MDAWDSRRKYSLLSKIEERQNRNSTIYTFQPVINAATTGILENVPKYYYLFARHDCSFLSQLIFNIFNLIPQLFIVF